MVFLLKLRNSTFELEGRGETHWTARGESYLAKETA